MTQPENDVGHVVLMVSECLARAQAGELAELRRMRYEHGSRLFWRLSAQHGIIACQPEKWAVIVRMLALLTPTGAPDSKRNVHDGKYPLGRVLCDGGETGRLKRPLLSESRLARLLSARGRTRQKILEHVVRMLARQHVKLNVVDLAWAVLNPENTSRIAKTYYQRLDAVPQNKTEESNNG